jgi:hypothetical protein
MFRGALVPANCTGVQWFKPYMVQAETLRPPFAEEPLDELVVEEDDPKRFRTISSLVLGAKLSVIGCWLEPCWLMETCSPPPLVGLMLMVMGSAVGLGPPLLLPMLRTISGPTLKGGADVGGVSAPDCFSKVALRSLNACCAPARSPDCRALPMAVKSCSRWGFENGLPLANGPPWPSWAIAWKAD